MQKNLPEDKVCKGTGRLVYSGICCHNRLMCLHPYDRANEAAPAATDCIEEPKSKWISGAP